MDTVVGKGNLVLVLENADLPSKQTMMKTTGMVTMVVARQENQRTVPYKESGYYCCKDSSANPDMAGDGPEVIHLLAEMKYHSIGVDEWMVTHIDAGL